MLCCLMPSIFSSFPPSHLPLSLLSLPLSHPTFLLSSFPSSSLLHSSHPPSSPFSLFLYSFPLLSSPLLSLLPSTIFPSLKVCECYSAVSEWQDLDMWYNHVGTLQSQSSGSPELSTAFSIQYDLNQLRYDSMTV